MNKHNFPAGFILFFFLFFFSQKTNAQFNLLSQQAFGVANVTEVAHAVEPLPGGGFVAAIYTLDNAGGALGSVHGEVVAYGSSGNILWQTTIGGSGEEEIWDMAVDAIGNIVVVGGSNSANLSNSSKDAWAVKLDGAGNILWENFYGGSNFERVESISLTSDGGYFLVGQACSNDGDIGPALPPGECGLWAFKLDSGGNLLWSEVYYGQGVAAFGNAGQQTPDGGYIIGGSAFGQGGDIPADNGDYDYWLTKIDAARNVQWTAVYGGIGPEFLKSLELTPDGSYLLCGYSNSQPSGDVSQHFGSTDYWVVKVDNTGGIVWEKSLGGSQFDSFAKAVIANNGEVFVAGQSSSNNGLVGNNYGNTDFWVVKLDANGNLLQEKNFGGSEIDNFASIGLSPNGIFVGGSTRSVDFDVTGFSGSNSTDAWLIEVGSGGGTGGGDIDLEISLSANPANPPIYSTTAVTATLNNTGTGTATGVAVHFPKPAGIVYEGGNEWSASQGSFNPNGDEVWTVGSIPSGGSATITVNYFMLTADPVTAYAQVSAANESDPDSSPGNGVPPAANEDDEAAFG
ncbi:MAG TPA: DUF11 domain-containing protein, partial [Bacteroidetes bacterium]|nr:DUF11 domain-containing protein [Bacteroidota bacterium]